MLQLFWTFLGLFGAKKVSDTFSIFPLQKYSNYNISDKGFQLIKEAEAKKANPDFRAYWDNDGKVYTIGFGNVDLFDDNGIYRGVVKPNDTLSSLKIKFGNSNLTDYQFAERLVKNHMKRKPISAYTIFNDLDSKGTPFIEPLAIALLDFCHNSGSFYKDRTGNIQYYYKQFIDEIVLINNDSRILSLKLKSYADAYAKYRVRHLVKYNVFNISGIVRRVITHSENIIGSNWDNSVNWRVLPTSQSVYNYLKKFYL